MKVAFFSRPVPPKLDGVGQYAWHLVRFLREAGVDARLFSEQSQSPAAEAWVYPVVKKWNGKGLLEALQSASGFEPDWCCFQYVPQMYGRYGICPQVATALSVLKVGKKCRVSVTFHEFGARGWHSLKELFFAEIFRWQTRQLLHVSDLAFTTCAGYQKMLQACTKTMVPIQVIPVGANIEVFSASPDELETLRRRYHFTGSAVMGIAGRLASFRNYPAAIRLLEQAGREKLKLKLLMIGCMESSEPVLFKELMDLAARLGVREQIEVTGDLSEKEFSHHMQLLDLFVFPQMDGISTRNTTIMSAMAHGLPIAAYAPLPGNFEGYEIPYGFLAARGDESVWIRTAIDFLKSNPDKAAEAAVSHAYFEKNFSWPRLSEDYVEAFKIFQGGERLMA